LRNDAAAEAERSQTLGLLEQYRSKILEEQNSNAFFDREQSVYDAAIDFRYSRTDDKEAVFNYLEESRARWLLDQMTRHSGGAAQGSRSGSQFRTLREVQTQLPDQTQLIEYAVLDDKLLICLVSKSEFSIRDVRISPDELANKVSAFRASILRERPEALSQGQELYKLLIKPVELSADNGEQVCIVPDKVLYSLPFVALVSPVSGRYVVEDYQVTLAPSATVHLACSERTNHTADRSHERLLAVGDPRFDQSAFPSLPLLPSTRQQVNKIAGFYRPSPVVLTGDGARENAVKREMDEADVIHLLHMLSTKAIDELETGCKGPSDDVNHGEFGGFQRMRS
jgi:CHAT domain-containing protein